jgi:putative endonuclease
LSWTVYIVECADGSLYTGITTDLDRRIDEHNSGTGARYTRGRRPVRLVHSEDLEDRGAASRREAKIKRMTREGKKELIGSAFAASPLRRDFTISEID